MARRRKYHAWGITELSEEMVKIEYVGLSLQELSRRLNASPISIKRAEQVGPSYRAGCLRRMEEERAKKQQRSRDEFVSLPDWELTDWYENGGYHGLGQGSTAPSRRHEGHHCDVQHVDDHNELISMVLEDHTVPSSKTFEERGEEALAFKTRQPEWAYTPWRRLHHHRMNIIHALSKRILAMEAREEYERNLAEAIREIEAEWWAQHPA